MPRIDIAAIDWAGGSGYPAPFAARVAGRFRKRLGNAAGLTQFGVNLTRLEPGAMSALRHWHENEDEFVYVLEGELVLVEEGGETRLTPGDAAAFKAGVANGHHLVNRSDRPALYLEIGTRAARERAHYPDDDLAAVKDAGGYRFTRKDGTPLG
ncbi:MAG: transcriptional regulator [Paracoccaceae bacterium]|nr:MAG: cupin domain-containing protein [Alphaproteobacteria bacterium]GIX15107.1 MAG: transcriptional regulator [Paracoccaceae bacterium]